MSKKDKKKVAEVLTEIKSQNDNVNHPSHYTSTPFGLEVIEITKHYNFCIGNALKYIFRAGLKHDAGMSDNDKRIEDLKKSVWYLNKEIETLGGTK